MHKKSKLNHDHNIIDLKPELINWVPTECAVCRKKEQYKVIYNENFSEVDLNFSGRKTPTQIHARIVKCKKCGLIYSNPFLPPNKLKELYTDCDYIIEPQIQNYCEDYMRQLKLVTSMLKEKNSLLEIGCGNGFFLRQSKEFGFKYVCGVEPGKQAFEMAHPSIKKAIINDFFKEGMFEENSFDIVCIFQVFDHVSNPNDVLSLIYKLLKPGGYILAINHNIKSLFARILGRRCPMIDIEHIYLFDKSTMNSLLSNHNFEVENIESLYSSYSIGYAVKMFPFPKLLKETLLKFCEWTKLSNLEVRFPGGNMVSIASKPFAN